MNPDEVNVDSLGTMTEKRALPMAARPGEYNERFQ
jgi:hypothetical protein